MDTLPQPPRRSNRSMLAGTALLLAMGGGIYWLWQSGRLNDPLAQVNLTMLGRGTPLETQQAHIEVLEEGVPVAAGHSGEGLGTPGAGTTRIDVAPVAVSGSVVAVSATPVAPVATYGQLDDVTGLKLGTTMALLTQAYANGGPLARTLANTAHELVVRAQDQGRAPAGLADTLMVLRSATPQVGPMTGLALVAESQRVLASGAPAGEAQAATAPAAQTTGDSWWQRQLEKFVTIKRGDEPTMTDWTRQMSLVQQQLARGATADAMANLDAAPLQADVRLEMLRTMLREYMDQQGKLQNAMNAYTQAYLLRDAAAQ